MLLGASRVADVHSAPIKHRRRNKWPTRRSLFRLMAAGMIVAVAVCPAGAVTRPAALRAVPGPQDMQEITVRSSSAHPAEP
jgi:hypothetical protein